jgi:uncharacterized protein
VELLTVRIDKPDAVNVVLGQAHFIKTVEDLHEALVTAVPGIGFGIAFSEASGPCLVRTSGTDPEMVELARDNALRIAAGHAFLVCLAEGYYPINVLNAIKATPEVCRVYCATANAVEVILAQTARGRAILGVVDGSMPVGVEGEPEVAARKALLRTIGYKL